MTAPDCAVVNVWLPALAKRQTTSRCGCPNRFMNPALNTTTRGSRPCTKRAPDELPLPWCAATRKSIGASSARYGSADSAAVVMSPGSMARARRCRSTARTNCRCREAVARTGARIRNRTPSHCQPCPARHVRNASSPAHRLSADQRAYRASHSQLRRNRRRDRGRHDSAPRRRARVVHRAAGSARRRRNRDRSRTEIADRRRTADDASPSRRPRSVLVRHRAR